MRWLWNRDIAPFTSLIHHLPPPLLYVVCVLKIFPLLSTACTWSLPLQNLTKLVMITHRPAIGHNTHTRRTRRTTPTGRFISSLLHSSARSEAVLGRSTSVLSFSMHCAPSWPGQHKDTRVTCKCLRDYISMVVMSYADDVDIGMIEV